MTEQTKDFQEIRAYWNDDAISLVDGVEYEGAVEIFIRDENGDTEYGMDYYSFATEEEGEKFVEEFNKNTWTTWEEYRKHY